MRQRRGHALQQVAINRLAGCVVPDAGYAAHGKNCEFRIAKCELERCILVNWELWIVNCELFVFANLDKTVVACQVRQTDSQGSSNALLRAATAWDMRSRGKRPSRRWNTD